MFAFIKPVSCCHEIALKLGSRQGPASFKIFKFAVLGRNVFTLGNQQLQTAL